MVSLDTDHIGVEGQIAFVNTSSVTKVPSQTVSMKQFTKTERKNIAIFERFFRKYGMNVALRPFMNYLHPIMFVILSTTISKVLIA